MKAVLDVRFLGYFNNDDEIRRYMKKFPARVSHGEDDIYDPGESKWRRERALKRFKEGLEPEY
jgi:hypothetical protein